MKNNHLIRKRFNDVIYNIARYGEILFSIIIIGAIAYQIVPLIHEVASFPLDHLDIENFGSFLAKALSLVVGLEFVRMLCRHSADALVEVLLMATARQMVVEHLSPIQTLISVLAIAVLFAIRKHLLIHPRGNSSQDSLIPEAPDTLS